MQFEKKMAASLLALKRHESSVQYMTLSPIKFSHAMDFHGMVDREGLFLEEDSSAFAEKISLPAAIYKIYRITHPNNKTQPSCHSAAVAANKLSQLSELSQEELNTIWIGHHVL